MPPHYPKDFPRSIDPDKATWRLSTKTLLSLIGTIVAVVVWGETRYEGLTSRLDRIEAIDQRNWSQYQMRDWAYSLEKGNRNVANSDPKVLGLFVPEVQIRQPQLNQSP